VQQLPERKGREFGIKFVACLKKKDSACLEGMLSKKGVQVDFEAFGCKGRAVANPYVYKEGVPHPLLTPKEFAQCALESKRRDDVCGEQGLTLAQALEEHFSSAVAIGGNFYFTRPSGFGSVLGEEDGKLVLNDFGCDALD
jgi:hypothetical protein